MEKETLSVSQAIRIIDTANEILSKSNSKMNKAFNQFLTDLSDVWEDKNAVELAKVVNDSYQKILENLTKNNQIFADTIVEIANSYKTAGGMQESISIGACGFGGQLDIGQVQEYFSDGNGDDFGFRDITVSPVQVMNALKEMESEIKAIAVEIVDAIKGIPAFGNQNVKLEIAKSAGKIVEIVDQALAKVRKSTEEQVTNTAMAYGKAGEAAIALVGGISDGIKDKIKDTINKPPQVKYAPPQPNTIVTVTAPQLKYAPPTINSIPVPAPQENVQVPNPPIIEAPPVQTKYAPPGMFGTDGKKN